MKKLKNAAMFLVFRFLIYLREKVISELTRNKALMLRNKFGSNI